MAILPLILEILTSQSLETAGPYRRVWSFGTNPRNFC